MSPSVAVFKTKILSIIPPPLQNLCLGFMTRRARLILPNSGLVSAVKFSKFQHNFTDTINPMCPSNDGIEDTEQFLLLCPSFGVQRTDLLTGIYTLVRPYGFANLANDVLLQILLYGDKDFPSSLNRNILELTIRFIHSTGLLE